MSRVSSSSSNFGVGTHRCVLRGCPTIGKPRALTSAEISADRTGIRLSPLGNSGGLDEGPEAADRASFFGGTEAGYTDYPALTA
jgi:hypothetical protein